MDNDTKMVIQQMCNTIYTITEMWESGEYDGSICSNDADKYTDVIISCCEVLKTLYEKG